MGADGNLYGTLPNFGIYGQGAVFKLTTNGAYSIIHHFGGVTNDGAYPASALWQGHDGFLYGVTSEGGSNYTGTVFKLSTDGQTYAVLWQFDGADGGNNPVGQLLQGANNFLYGATAYGGENNGGIVFSLSTEGGNFTILHAFPSSPADAAQPQAGLLAGQDGMLYGTTQGGGSNYNGTVFRLNMDGGGEQVIYSFTGTTDGMSPTAPLLQGAGGVLYGETSYGGANSDGVIFSLNPNGSGYASQHVFSGAEGLNPSGGLALGPDGAIYGTVQSGGTSGFGGIFRLVPGVTALAPLYSPTSVTLNFTGGVPGQGYAVYVSTNLVSWGLVGPATADSDGNFQISDANIAGQPARFYRSAGP
jgi:uncharacterized repeat protein (TIGR03803 family)